MKNRLLAALLALPLLAFDCGGKEEPPFGFGGDPFGLGCKLHVAGAGADEDLWCIVTAYDYSAFPDAQLRSNLWVFEIVAYRGMIEIGAGAGIFLGDRPAIGTTYGWNGTVATSLVNAGDADRYGPGMERTHSATSLGSGSGTGSLYVRFTRIPPPSATNEELLGVHGTLSAILKPLAGGGDAAVSATF